MRKISMAAGCPFFNNFSDSILCGVEATVRFNQKG
jgi:hypothetical protein